MRKGVTAFTASDSRSRSVSLSQRMRARNVGLLLIGAALGGLNTNAVGCLLYRTNGGRLRTDAVSRVKDPEETPIDYILCCVLSGLLRASPM